jgi:hypothetical protein
MFEHFAGISLANAFFDERAMIFVKRRVLGHILVGRGLSHKTYCIRLSALMEIVRPHFEITESQWLYPFSLDMDYAVLILQRSLDQNKFAACDDNALPLIKIGSHDDIRNTCLILHRNKDETFRSPWTLPRNDTAG